MISPTEVSRNMESDIYTFDELAYVDSLEPFIDTCLSADDKWFTEFLITIEEIPDDRKDIKLIVVDKKYAYSINTIVEILLERFAASGWEVHVTSNFNSKVNCHDFTLCVLFPKRHFYAKNMHTTLETLWDGENK